MSEPILWSDIVEKTRKKLIQDAQKKGMFSAPTLIFCKVIVYDQFEMPIFPQF